MKEKSTLHNHIYLYIKPTSREFYLRLERRENDVELSHPPGL